MGSCCSKPVTRIIKVGNSQAGIIGLDAILKQVKEERLTEKGDLERELLVVAKKHGNYIASSVERAYKEALLREYREFCRRQEPQLL